MDHLRITVAGKVYDVIVEKITDDEPENQAPSVRSIAPAAIPVVAQPLAIPVASQVKSQAGDVTSPLAGIVQAVAVGVGSLVNEGDLIITLEAMKMYTSINASVTGTIKTIAVKQGDAVEEGQVLYSIG